MYSIHLEIPWYIYFPICFIFGAGIGQIVTIIFDIIRGTR